MKAGRALRPAGHTTGLPRRTIMRISLLLIGAVALCALSGTAGQAQNFPGLHKIVAPLPNGSCPAGTHVIIVNTTLGAQRVCST